MRSAVPPATVRSRRLLVEAVLALDPLKDALTVVGAHAVMAHAERIGHVPDSTANADTALNPSLVAASPAVLDLMAEIGLNQANPARPGIYGYSNENHIEIKQRTTIDLIVPEAYAGPGRRAARVEGQKNAFTRAPGLELALFDHEIGTMATIPGDGEPLSAEVQIAGAGALLVAKGHKVSDRLAQFDSRPARLRPKDSGDIGLLMLSSSPEGVSEQLSHVVDEHPETLEIARQGLRLITASYRKETSIVYHHLVDELADEFPDVAEQVASWIDSFVMRTRWLT